MSENLVERLKRDILVMYLPMQTALLDWGKEMESHLSKWIIDNPDKYQDALSKSYEAGCDLGHTATQAASTIRCKTFGLEDNVEEYNVKSAQLAKQVTPDGCFVVGNISVSNPDFMEPAGNLTKQEVSDSYKRQILALAEGGVDALHIGGSQMDALEIALKIAKKYTNLPVLAAPSYYKMIPGFRTLYGTDPIATSKMCEQAGAEIIGFICGGVLYEQCCDLIKEINIATDKPSFSQPNPGTPELRDGKTFYPDTPDDFEKWSEKWIQAGARLVGSCCGTTLEHYRKASKVVRKWRDENIEQQSL